jgi:regulator of sirC expression with transglutaminase-like and TPR domain
MLKDSEWLALVKLLDDEDAEVRQIAHNRIAQSGQEGLLKLEALADEVGELAIRNAILALMETLTTESITSQLLAWRQGGGEDLLSAWILLSRLQKNPIEESKIHGEITRLTNKIWLEMNEQMYAFDKLRVFNHVFFVMEGYHLLKESPELPSLCFIDQVLVKKEGNAQSLCLLYLIVATRLELPVAGVILPGYSFIYCFDDRQPFYIDVANGGNFISREGIEVFIKKMGLQEQSSWYKPTTNIRLILNLLEILRKSYYATNLSAQAKRVEQIQEGIDIRFE